MGQFFLCVSDASFRWTVGELKSKSRQTGGATEQSNYLDIFGELT